MHGEPGLSEGPAGLAVKAELSTALRPALESLMEELACERAFLALMDPAQASLRATLGINIPQELLPELVWKVDATPGPLLQCLLQGRPVRVDDALHDAGISESLRQRYVSLGMLSFVAVPLLPVLGVLAVSRATPFSQAEVEQLSAHARRFSEDVAGLIEEEPLQAGPDPIRVENEWLTRMLYAVPDPVILSDQEGQVVLWNRRAASLLESGAEDSLGRRRALELNSVLLSAALSSFALDQGASLGRELTLVDPIEGDELLFEVICQPVTNLLSGERGLVTVLKDVSDLRQASYQMERSLADLSHAGELVRQERDRLRLILGNVTHPIILANPQGEIVHMNQPAERLLGAAETEARGSSVLAANSAKFSSFLSQLGLAGGGALRDEMELVDPQSGARLVVSIVATEVRDELGRVRAIVCALHDLTEIRELARHRAEQQMMEAANRQREQFISMIAHELGQPLTTIRGYAQLIRREGVPAEVHEQALRAIDTQTARMSRLVRDLADASHLAAGRFTIQRGHCDLAEVVSERVQEARLAAGEQEIRLKAPACLPAWCDRDRLGQVLSNLLTNALNYAPEGPVQVELNGEDGQAHLTVRDQGPGIPRKRLKAIFQPYGRLSQRQEGVGLGLYIARGIVEAHGGRLWVDSQPGKGSAFHVLIPIRSAGRAGGGGSRLR